MQAYAFCPAPCRRCTCWLLSVTRLYHFDLPEPLKRKLLWSYVLWKLKQNVLMCHPTFMASLWEALPMRARAPTPAVMAADLNSDKAMTNVHSSSLGSLHPRSLQYASMKACSDGMPANTCRASVQGHGHQHAKPHALALCTFTFFPEVLGITCKDVDHVACEQQTGIKVDCP